MKKHTIQDLQVINIPKITDPRGNISVVENNLVPFDIKRVYYLYDVPSGAARGGHAHIDQQAFLIPMSGSFNVILHDGKDRRTITLKRPNEGLLIPTGIWRELEDFSSGAVCLVLASDVFSEEDYIRDFQKYKEYYK